MILESTALVVSIIALLFSIAGYFNFYRREVEKDQVKLVLDLLGSLQNTKLHVRRYNRSRSLVTDYLIYSGSLIGMSYQNDESPMFVPADFSAFMEIASYNSNPILPSKISKCLRDAFPTQFSNIKTDQLPPRYVLALESIILDAKELDENYPREMLAYCISNLPSYDEFSSSITQLSREIRAWLTSKRVHDLNNIG